MLSNSLNKRLLVALCVGLSGCATRAPDLPRATSQTTEPGYTAAAAPLAMVVPTSTAAPETGASAIVTPVPIMKPPALITQAVWGLIEQSNKDAISAAYEVRLMELSGFGTIIDVQGVDQSTAGTNGGAALGGAVASAAYIDRAFRGNNSYSAGANLAFALLGAVIGSAMDKAPQSQFQFRYTVKLGNGDIQYFDEVKASSFRHSVGICVLLPSLDMVNGVCEQTPGGVKTKYLTTVAAQGKRDPVAITYISDSAENVRSAAFRAINDAQCAPTKTPEQSMLTSTTREFTASCADGASMKALCANGQCVTN